MHKPVATWVSAAGLKPNLDLATALTGKVRLQLVLDSVYFYYQENLGTSIDGRVMDYFEEKGAGYQYVSLRNEAGAGKYFFLSHCLDSFLTFV